jgi:hypothetical protein
MCCIQSSVQRQYGLLAYGLHRGSRAGFRHPNLHPPCPVKYLHPQKHFPRNANTPQLTPYSSRTTRIWSTMGKLFTQANITKHRKSVVASNAQRTREIWPSNGTGK